MKRNLDLLRDMMVRIEDSDTSKRPIDYTAFLDLCDDPALVRFHLALLYDAGYIEALEQPTGRPPKNYFVYRLTFTGCEYLDSIRNQSVWSEIKGKLTPIGGACSMGIVKTLASAIVKERLGI